jgi:sterol desaturase/sphingolipid hydroxylase (fatty acid hydroxylase superfamily)
MTIEHAPSTQIVLADKLPAGFLAGLLIATSAALFWSFHQVTFFQNTVPDFISSWFSFLPYANSAVSYIYFGMAKVLVCAIPFIAVEFFADPSKRFRLRELYLFPLFLWGMYFALTTFVIFLAVKIQAFLGIVPLLERFGFGLTAQILVWIIVTDFVIYWYHRLEHSIPFLWQFHSTHHAIEDLNSINQYGHWLEGMVRFFMVTLPVSVFISTPVLTASVIGLIYTVWAVYNHSDVSALRLPKWLTPIFADNVYHRYHHGVKPEYHNSNYSNMFAFWDYLFGTQNMPKGDSFPATGLGYLPPPKSIKDFLIHPWGLIKKK